jgi:hypothetical protein
MKNKFFLWIQNKWECYIKRRWFRSIKNKFFLWIQDKWEWNIKRRLESYKYQNFVEF